MDGELYTAAKEGRVRFLQESHRICRSEEYFLSKSHKNNNIIHLAARHGHASFIEKALEKFSVLFNQVNSEGDTPLHVAARFGHHAVARLLVGHYKCLYSQPDKEASVETQMNATSSRREIKGLANEDVLPPLWRILNLEGNTAIHEALRNGHEEVSLYLLALDPDIACFVNSAGEGLLYLAAESCCEEVMKQILESGLPCNTQGPHGQNALHAAKNCSSWTICRLLKERPNLAKEVDDCGKAAIHYAVEAEYWGLIHCMLAFDTSIAYLPDADGLTPLLRASTKGCWKICLNILKMCPDSIEAHNNKGQNVFHLYHRWKYILEKDFLTIPEIIELINEPDNEGNTPLHVAIKDCHYEKATLLLSINTIDVNAINKEGLTALDICERDSKFSYKQSMMWFHLRSRGAKRGRCPNQFNVPVEGPNKLFHSPNLDLKAIVSTQSVIAALLVTVTFAAAFTMPGGFNSSGDNLGVAILIKKAALRAFILSDALAMCSSIVVVYFLTWAMVVEAELGLRLVRISWRLLYLALCATLVAFVAGLYAVTATEASWVALLACTMASIVPFVVHRWAVMSIGTGIRFLPFAIKDNLHLEQKQRWRIKRKMVQSSE